MVYVVDDDASVCKSLSMLILSAGFKVQTFELAEDLLHSVRQQEGSCLVADIEMKGMNGLDLHTKLQEKGIHIPTIFLTASDTEGNREIAKQKGAHGYLTKPVDAQALLDTIAWAMTSTHSKKV